jgi:hypothetical protein
MSLFFKTFLFLLFFQYSFFEKKKKTLEEEKEEGRRRRGEKLVFQPFKERVLSLSSLFQVRKKRRRRRERERRNSWRNEGGPGPAS